MPLAPGARLGAYEILAPLGAGGTGEVYRARDPHLGRDVAVKVLSPDLARDREAVARFEREARTASSLNHPHIVHIYDIGEATTESGPTRYIAMELVDGQTLRARLRGRQPWSELLEPLVQVADALAKAHHAGIVHRDLKPENIIISSDGYAKVLDFGLAKLLAEPVATGASTTDAGAASVRTRTGIIVGTIGYMSPEQAEGHSIDARSDIFSFGSVLYEVITGRQPFKGASTLAILHAIRYEDPPIESLGAPRDLRAVVAKCLAKSPDGRFQSASDLANALRAVMHKGAVAEPARAIASRRPMAAAVGAVIVVAAAIGLWTSIGRGPKTIERASIPPPPGIAAASPTDARPLPAPPPAPGRPEPGITSVQTPSYKPDLSARDAYSFATLLIQAQSWQDAIPLLDLAIKIDPKPSQIREGVFTIYYVPQYYLFVAYLETDQLEKARQFYALRGQLPRRLADEAELYLKELTRRERNNALLASYGGSFDALIKLGDTSLAARQYDQATKFYNAANKVLPDEFQKRKLDVKLAQAQQEQTEVRNTDRDAHDGLFALLAGDAARAAPLLERALKNSPSSSPKRRATISGYLGVAYATLSIQANGDAATQLRSKALEQHRQALQLQPDFKLDDKLVSDNVRDVFKGAAR